MSEFGFISFVHETLLPRLGSFLIRWPHLNYFLLLQIPRLLLLLIGLLLRFYRILQHIFQVLYQSIPFSQMFLCEFVPFLKIKKSLLHMRKCIINNVWDTRVQPPCCGKQWTRLRLVTGLCFRCPVILLGAKWSSKAHFIRLKNAYPTVTTLHISSSTYPPKYPPFCSSIPVPRHFASTSTQSLISQFFDNNKRNYCRLQQCTWHLWDRRTRPFWGTWDRGRTFIFGGGSWKWCCRVHIAWWKCVRIIRWQCRIDFCWGQGLTGRRRGPPCTCLTFGGFKLFLQEFRFFIWEWGSLGGFTIIFCLIYNFILLRFIFLFLRHLTIEFLYFFLKSYRKSLERNKEIGII